MVGVPGKYKGCNTCRLRRVKCDNKRPFCKKCIDSGRDCAGYERETVFIVGTVEDGGRCSSHPRRVIKSKKDTSASAAAESSQSEAKQELTAKKPLRPAWDDYLTVSNGQSQWQLQLASLRTNPDAIVRGPSYDGSSFGVLDIPPYEFGHASSAALEDDIEIKAEALLRVTSEEEVNSMAESGAGPSQICIFLYDHNIGVAGLGNLLSSREAEMHHATVQQQGPEAFRRFPSHHFFVRVFRHNSICVALINRQPTFLSEPQWTTIPWERHPKSSLDKLFDVIVLLPTIFSQADGLITHSPTMARRMLAQNLLEMCHAVESQFSEWLAEVSPQGSRNQPAVFWIDDSATFGETYAFVDGMHAIMLVYYWTSLMLFYPCVASLYEVVFQPVVDVFPQVFPDLPPHLAAVNPLQYGPKEVSELATNVCRSLDFAMCNTTQLDMLAMPLLVVEDFYRDVQMVIGDGQVELMWCSALRQRLAARGEDMMHVVQTGEWQSLARW